MSYFSGAMPKKKETKRIEVHLMPDDVRALEALAAKANRSLKNYCETILLNHIEVSNNPKKASST